MLLMPFSATVSAFADDITLEDDILTEENGSAPSLDGSANGTANLEEAIIALTDRLESASALILTDYTESTAEGLRIAISEAEQTLSDDNVEYSAIISATVALDEAISALEAKKADISDIKLIYTMYKYYDNKSEYNQIELAEAMSLAEEALNDSDLLISEAEAVIKALNSVSLTKAINSAEDFMAMVPNGNYFLNCDIELIESYGEFSGYLYGNGYSITASSTGVFNSLSGAEIINLKIKGNIESDVTVGALARVAKGNVTLIDVINNADVTVNSESAIASGFIAIGEGADVTFSGCVNNGTINGGISAGFYGESAINTYEINFYNSINNGDIIGFSTASGFVASGATSLEDISFEYCASLGSITSQDIASAFLGVGECNVALSGCVAGEISGLSVTSKSNVSSFGAIIGYIDGESGVDIHCCSFNVNLHTNDYASLVIYTADSVNVSVQSTYVLGNLFSHGGNVYRLTNASSENLICDTVCISVSVVAQIDGSEVINPNKSDTSINIDFESLDAEMLNEASCNITAFVTASNGMNVDAKIEALELFKKSFGMLKTPAEAELYRAQVAIMVAIREILKSPNGYTEKSYADYVYEIATLLNVIEATENAEALNAIDVESAVAAAESRLVSLLDMAKADALVLLSAKRENAGKVFTANSYEAYCLAYDLIVEKINSAESIEALNAINLPLLKVEAEAKLIVDLPVIAEEDDEPEDKEIVNDSNADEAPNDAEPDEPKKDSGCASSLSLSVIAIASTLGLAILRKRD